VPHRFDLIELGDIRNDLRDNCSLRLDVGVHAGYRVQVAAVDRDPCASSGEQARNRGTNSARTACDQSHFVF
jgi:hypothetical protein